MTEKKETTKKAKTAPAKKAKKGVPNSEATRIRSGTEAVEKGRKGGVASGAARREKKILTEILMKKLAKKLPDGGTVGEAVVDSIIATAMAGDVKAFVAIADRVEGKPVQQVDVSGELSVADRLLAARARMQQKND